MYRLIGAKECPIEDLELVGDDLMKWRFKIRSFDDSSQGTHRLERSLAGSRSMIARHLLQDRGQNGCFQWRPAGESVSIMYSRRFALSTAKTHQALHASPHNTPSCLSHELLVPCL